MTWRLRFLFSIFLLFFLLIVARLYHWQIIKAEELSLLGNSQYGRFIKLFPERGEVKTSDNFPIATNKLSYLVFANPKEVKNKEQTSILLASFLHTEKATISAFLSLDLMWIALKKDVDNITKKEIEKLSLDGIGFEQQSVRYYPESSMAAQLIGFVGKNALGENKGYFGIEGYYDRQLSGKIGIGTQIHDALGKPILSHVNDSTKPVEGRSLILNIDRSMQFIVEKKLKEGIEKYQAAGGMVGIIDPSNGNVLAMASFPSFDPKFYQDYPEEVYKNPFISNMFEPGSTFKPLIMAAALDANVIKPETKCDICAGPVTIHDYQIRTWNNTYHKDLTMTEVIQYSDNIGMVYVSKSLGLPRMLSYFDKFRIGSLTGIDLQGEAAPQVKPKENWYPIDVATVSFGQGITVTPIELLVAFASLANEGKMMEPHIVSKIETSDGNLISIPPKIIATPVSSKTAKIMTEILVNAVDKGEAKFAKPKGYRIAGKTGTAQIPIAGHYDPNKTIASFIGFAPADNPRFAMLVVIDRPTTSIYGSETAAPVFFNIAKEILGYYNISPTQ